MLVVLSSNSDSLETSAVANYVLLQLESSVVDMSQYFSEMIAFLKKEHGNLSMAIGIEKKGNLTEELSIADNEFDEQFKCVKLFVEANRHCSDPERQEAANAVYRVIELNNSNLHRLSYEIEATASGLLLEDLEKPENVAHIAKLTAVADELLILKEKTNKLRSLLDERTNNEAMKEKVTPSYLQRKVVRDELNFKIRPYLDVKSKEEVEKFGIVTRKIETYISEMNGNIKLRMAKGSSSEPKSSEEEENQE